MFDLAWSAIALIVVVAIVVIGPKDLPDAVRGVARMVKKARTMAAEFRGQADELVREANLHEVRDSINEIRNFNIKDTLEKAVDGDGSLRQGFAEDPLRDYPHTPTGDTLSGGVDAMNTAAATPAFVPPEHEPAPALAEAPPAPAFVPPAFVPPADAAPRRKPS